VPALPEQLTPAGLEFLRERHLATFTSLRSDGSPHVTPVGFTWDARHNLARVITSRSSRKARNAERGSLAAICQMQGRHWLTLQGTCHVATDPAAVADAVVRYTERYRAPRQNPTRVAIEIAVTRVFGSSAFITPL
jgi:PPOX class probable F420-dependent enzyme